MIPRSREAFTPPIFGTERGYHFYSTPVKGVFDRVRVEFKLLGAKWSVKIIHIWNVESELLLHLLHVYDRLPK